MFANTVRLYAVLGGGWNEAKTADAKTGNP
jgi:hypothetical protein